VSDDPSLLAALTAAGTVGAAAVAAVSVLVSGRQGRNQQRLLIEAEKRNALERRADFELGVLLEISAASREAWRLLQPNLHGDEARQIRALLLALHVWSLPTLRAAVGPAEARGRLEQHKGENYYRDVQRAIDEELRASIALRRDLAPRIDPTVSARLARRVPWKPRSWLRPTNLQVRGPELPEPER
jgi:hypothetical protein